MIHKGTVKSVVIQIFVSLVLYSFVGSTCERDGETGYRCCDGIMVLLFFLQLHTMKHFSLTLYFCSHT